MHKKEVGVTLVPCFLRGGVVLGGIFGALTGLIYFLLMSLVAPELQGQTLPYLL